MKTAALALSFALGAAMAATTHGASSIDIGIRIGAPPPVRVRQAPPARVVEHVTVAPAQGYVWVPGHYSWASNGYVWVRGAWVMPPRPDALWVEGRWEPSSQQWIEGYWAVPQATPPPPPPSSPPQVYGPTSPAPHYGNPANPAGEIYVEQPPPPPRQDVIVARPSPQHVWVAGYWSWDNSARRHTWQPGHWDRPPPGRSRWDPPRWERRGRGQVFIEGHWR